MSCFIQACFIYPNRSKGALLLSKQVISSEGKEWRPIRKHVTARFHKTCANMLRWWLYWNERGRNSGQWETRIKRSAHESCSKWKRWASGQENKLVKKRMKDVNVRTDTAPKNRFSEKFFKWNSRTLPRIALCTSFSLVVYWNFGKVSKKLVLFKTRLLNDQNVYSSPPSTSKFSDGDHLGIVKSDFLIGNIMKYT